MAESVFGVIRCTRSHRQRQRLWRAKRLQIVLACKSSMNWGNIWAIQPRAHYVKIDEMRSKQKPRCYSPSVSIIWMTDNVVDNVWLPTTRSDTCVKFIIWRQQNDVCYVWYTLLELKAEETVLMKASLLLVEDNVDVQPVPTHTTSSRATLL